MFEVGFTEIVLILGLALLVLGPEKLPGLAEKVGRWTGRARAMARQLRTQLEHEVTLEELARSKPMNTSSSTTSSSAPASEPTPAPTDIDGVPHESSAQVNAQTSEPQWGDSEDSSSGPSTTKPSQ